MSVITPGFHGRRPDRPDRLPPGQFETADFPVLSAGPTPRIPPDRWRLTLTAGPAELRSWTWREFLALPSEEPTVDIHCVTRWSKFDTRWRGVPVAALLDGVETGGALPDSIETGGSLLDGVETGGALPDSIETGGALLDGVETGGALPDSIETGGASSAGPTGGAPSAGPTGGAFVMVHSYGGYTTNLPLADLLDRGAWVVHTYDGRPLAPEHGGPARLLVPHLYFWKSAKWVNRIELMDADRAGFWEDLGYHDYGDPWREQRYQGD